MINLLVTGSKGQLGSKIKDLERNYPRYNFFFTDSKSLNITDHLKVNEFIINNKIDVIINCAAFTDVDKAERKFDLANKVNNIAVSNLAQISKDNNIKLIHISTDYVFDGLKGKPYNEMDTPNPKTIYGKTKLNGELEMQKISPKNSIILRTSWLYSNAENNFPHKILKQANYKSKIDVVNDQIGSPTSVLDLANTILKILPKINSKNVELYHFSNDGSCSRLDFAKEILRLRGLKIALNSVASHSYYKRIKRPLFTVLDSSAIKNKFKLSIPYWKKSLDCLLMNSDG
jgi:dTDP-4-dehydrorhamnose reductase